MVLVCHTVFYCVFVCLCVFMCVSVCIHVLCLCVLTSASRFLSALAQVATGRADDVTTSPVVSPTLRTRAAETTDDTDTHFRHTTEPDNCVCVRVRVCVTLCCRSSGAG